MGKAENFLNEKEAAGSVEIEAVQKELARGHWGRIATETIDGLTSYWFDDGSRLIAGSFDGDEFIIRAAPAFSEDELHNMPPDEAKEHRAMIDSLKGTA
ncbi:hypothetical protein NB311A_13041 [Nitrobacter sp. Nb-311A]|jgi:hypothetical protein|uniref:hypothetical protein n=1 Tax=Nitrobacter sp. Nb-311A TaxID=314253 RepID=UPI00006849A5|nr:hypothetical protein [Nitrobacter sp. Nb-311A]EAQ35243.1 hypothetical protein NB311A_13041 [Nitrobacter sp. Nb-311A]